MMSLVAPQGKCAGEVDQDKVYKFSSTIEGNYLELFRSRNYVTVEIY
jgi:hypothetical protein